MLSLRGIKGLALIRAIDWRTSFSRFEKASSRNAGRMPVSSSIWALTSSSLNVSMPQSVWWIRMTSSVPSSRCEIVSERIASVVATPPALRKTWASPSWSPRILLTCSLASMQARTNSFLAGGSGKFPAPNDRAYASLFFNRSSVTLTMDPPSLSSATVGHVNWSIRRMSLGLFVQSTRRGCRIPGAFHGLCPGPRRQHRQLPARWRRTGDHRPGNGAGTRRHTGSAREGGPFAGRDHRRHLFSPSPGPHAQRGALSESPVSRLLGYLSGRQLGTPAGGGLCAQPVDPPDRNARAHAARHHHDGLDQRWHGSVHASLVVGRGATRGPARLGPASPPPQPGTRAGDCQAYRARPWGTV